MTLDAILFEAMRQVVRSEVEPLRQEVAALRRDRDAAPVTVAEAAKRRGVSRRTIERAIRNGDLKVVQVGNVRRVVLG